MQYKNSNYTIDLRKTSQNKREGYSISIVDILLNNESAYRLAWGPISLWYHKILTLFLLIMILGGPVVRVYANEEEVPEKLQETSATAESPEAVTDDNVKGTDIELFKESDARTQEEITKEKNLLPLNNTSDNDESYEEEFNVTKNQEEVPQENDFKGVLDNEKKEKTAPVVAVEDFSSSFVDANGEFFEEQQNVESKEETIEVVFVPEVLEPENEKLQKIASAQIEENQNPEDAQETEALPENQEADDSSVYGREVGDIETENEQQDNVSPINKDEKESLQEELVYENENIGNVSEEELSEEVSGQIDSSDTLTEENESDVSSADTPLEEYSTTTTTHEPSNEDDSTADTNNNTALSDDQSFASSESKNSDKQTTPEEFSSTEETTEKTDTQEKENTTEQEIIYKEQGEENTPLVEDNTEGVTSTQPNISTASVAEDTEDTTDNNESVFKEEYTVHNSFFDNDSKYVFNDKECVLVREYEFYCIKSNANNNTVLPTPDMDTQKGEVFVRKDSDGDKEIFINKNGNIIKITNNLLDDDSPARDEENGLVVWHALIKERYQIMLYDESSGTTKQITNTSFNNTNPSVYGNFLVWQGWINDNWEIFTAEISTTDSITITQITNNNYHDMFPKVYKGLITWQGFIGNSWEVFVYDLSLNKISRVREGGQGAYESPRFVLLLENRKENGDVEKVGYDVSSGEEIALGTTPRDRTNDTPIAPEDTAQDQERALPNESNGTTTPKTSHRSDGDAEE